MATAALAAAAARYGKLWGRGQETFTKNVRRVLAVKGNGNHPTNYLQGLVTCDLHKEPKAPKEIAVSVKTTTGNSEGDNDEVNNVMDMEGMPPPVDVEFTSKMRSTCFLDQKGRILTDAILWRLPFKDNDDGDDDDDVAGTNNAKKDNANEEMTYLIDVPGDSADMLLEHLQKYKLRRTKVQIKDVSDDYSVHCIYGTLNAKGAPPGFLSAMDPRHPTLGMRILSYSNAQQQQDNNNGDSSSSSPSSSSSTHEERTQKFTNLTSKFFPPANGTYNVLRKLKGIAEGTEIKGRTALECNQEFLNAIHFDKGCYLGQELTARSQFVGTIRKRIMPIVIVDTNMEVPRPWVMASKLQDIGVENLEEEVVKNLGIGVDGDGKFPPMLPKISAPGIGGIVAMMQGNLRLPEVGETTSSSSEQQQQQQQAKQVELSEEEKEMMKRLQAESENLMQELESTAIPGAKIIDQENGKTIGEIISTPASGTPVVLAQMRLDQVGLLQGNSNKKDGDRSKWSYTNKVTIGDSSRVFRYLPFIPLWWPEIDPTSGKERVEES